MKDMEKTELQAKIYSKIDELPTIPAQLPKLLYLVENSETNTSDLSDMISRDLAMTSKILKVANSAYYGFQKKVSDLDRAVPLLGFNMVKSLALSIGIINSLPSERKNQGFSREGLWIHSLAVATLMEELNRRLNKRDKSEYVFIIGLLHDIGKIVLDQFFNELFQQALEEVRESGKSKLYVAERRVIGVDHGEIGDMLLTRWNFPDVISNPIAVHHQAGVPEGTNVNDAAMLRIADALSQGFGLGEEETSIPPEINKDDLEVLKMKDEELEDLKTYLNGARDGIYDFFNAMG